MIDITGIIIGIISLAIIPLMIWWMFKAFKSAKRNVDGFTCKECGKKYNIKMETEKDLCQKYYDKRK